MKTHLYYAEAYADKHLPVLALHFLRDDGACSCAEAHACTRPGKHPFVYRSKAGLVGCPNGVLDATTDPAKLRDLFRVFPRLNIGIATGAASQWTVVDVDAGKEPGAVRAFRDLVAAWGLTPTLSSVTGSGGRHYVYHHAPGDDVPSKQGISTGIDIRGRRGYIVAPPSLHVSGHRYEWIRTHTRLEELPHEAVAALKEADATVAPPAQRQISKGMQHAVLLTFAGRMRRFGADYDEILAALRVMNANRCEAPGTERYLADMVRSVCKYTPDDNPTMIARNILKSLGRLNSVFTE